MVDFNKLTVKYLEKLANECKVPLKKSDNKSMKIKTIKKAGIPEIKLNSLFKKFLAEYQASKKPKKVSKAKPTIPIKNIEGRINLLEKQVKYLMSKIDNFEIKFANIKSPTSIGSSHTFSEIKNVILSQILPGDSIKVDDLLEIKKLKPYSLTSIEKTIIELIDDEILDVSEGSSKVKLQGNIGRLIRR